MNIWFLLWLVLSCAMLGFMFWAGYMIYRQKRSWKRYASKHKINYKPGSLYESPQMRGKMDGYIVHFFTGEHNTPDMRRTRKLTAIEIQLTTHLPVEGGVASGQLVEFLDDFGFAHEHVPSHPGWDSAYRAACENKHIIDAYLTPERLENLTGLMKIPNAWVILVFKNDTSLLRIDVPDPLETDEKLDAVIKPMLKAAHALEIGAPERSLLMQEKAKKEQAQAKLDLPQDELSDTGLRLEDDEE